MTSELQPGVTVGKDTVSFRVFCPRARSMEVIVQDRFRNPGHRFKQPMSNEGNGWWRTSIKGNLTGYFYGYMVTSSVASPNQPISEHPIPDPYARVWAVENSYQQNPLSKIVVPEPFDWQGDTFLSCIDPRDLIIYETHIKDLTAHPSSKSEFGSKSAFQAFLTSGQTGGIEHLKKLGVNAVEFLPLQHFSYFEPSYLEATPDGVLNTWNYYGKNYWGYMPSSWFVPHLLYASGASESRNEVVDNGEVAIREMKTLVRACHKAGIAVIVDVVYNHISQYDLNPLKYLDINYYLRKNSAGYFTSDSGCGNDFKTEAKEARALILASLKYWMTEFHVDGFRFDLAKILDWETVESIKDELRSVNPYVILIAEPWGGGYDPQGFSYRDWAAWNDQIRNGVKGSDPFHDHGFIFGKWHHGTSRFALENYLKGTLVGKDGGRFLSSRHTVNYLESHDNHTLADFIRIALNPARAIKTNETFQEAQTLNEQELKLSRLAALFLLTSQGITMIHAGQELGRSKRIAASPENDPNTGHIDHNSYEKDNETNWINFELLHLNRDLFNWYSDLIAFRKKAKALRSSPPQAYTFAHANDPLLIDVQIDGRFSGDIFDYRIVLNGNATHAHRIQLAPDWMIAVTQNHCYPSGIPIKSPHIVVPSSTGAVFIRKRKFPE